MDITIAQYLHLFFDPGLEPVLRETRMAAIASALRDDGYDVRSDFLHELVVCPWYKATGEPRNLRDLATQMLRYEFIAVIPNFHSKLGNGRYGHAIHIIGMDENEGEKTVTLDFSGIPGVDKELLRLLTQWYQLSEPPKDTWKLNFSKKGILSDLTGMTWRIDDLYVMDATVTLVRVARDGRHVYWIEIEPEFFRIRMHLEWGYIPEAL